MRCTLQNDSLVAHWMLHFASIQFWKYGYTIKEDWTVKGQRSLKKPWTPCCHFGPESHGCPIITWNTLVAIKSPCRDPADTRSPPPTTHVLMMPPMRRTPRFLCLMLIRTSLSGTTDGSHVLDTVRDLPYLELEAQVSPVTENRIEG